MNRFGEYLFEPGHCVKIRYCLLARNIDFLEEFCLGNISD